MTNLDYHRRPDRRLTRFTLVVVVMFMVVSGLIRSAPARGSPGVAPPDPLLREQWNLHIIEAPTAWRYSTGRGVTVAVIDTGIDMDHPDFRPKRIASGFNVINPSAPPRDDNGHGTHVAGIVAAASSNGKGIAGVAPRATILPIKVCNSGGFCNDYDIAAGTRYATNNGADVINLSLGLGLVTSKTEEGARRIRAEVERARAAGIVVVAAAGNFSLPICQDPGAYVLCVGATDPQDLRSFYSNGDATLATNYLVAPGGDGHSVLGPAGSCDGEIVSTYPTSQEPFACSEGIGYARLTGTSQAAPHVAGVAALVMARAGDHVDVIETILETADDIGTPGRDPLYGYGRVNALEAVEAVDETSSSGRRQPLSIDASRRSHHGP